MAAAGNEAGMDSEHTITISVSPEAGQLSEVSAFNMKKVPRTWNAFEFA
jgi:hypothetical protein